MFLSGVTILLLVARQQKLRLLRCVLIVDCRLLGCLVEGLQRLRRLHSILRVKQTVRVLARLVVHVVPDALLLILVALFDVGFQPLCFFLVLFWLLFVDDAVFVLLRQFTKCFLQKFLHFYALS